MTRRDFITKWFIFALALLPIWFLECYVFDRLRIFGVTPMMLPMAAVAVAVLEGGMAGGGFGLAVGILCDALYHGTGGAMTLALCALGVAAGFAAQYLVRQNLVGCLLCSAGALALIDGFRVLWRLFGGVAALPALLRVAVPEVLVSLAFVFPIYGIFLWVHNRTQFATLF